MQRKTNSLPTPLCTSEGRKRNCLASCYVHALCATLAFAFASDAVPSALAQNAGVEFTLFPANQGNGQMYVSAIRGVSADGNSAAVRIANGPTAVGWWNRTSGLHVVPPSTFVVNNTTVPASVWNITADGNNLVGAYLMSNLNTVFFYNETSGLRSIGMPTTTVYSDFFGPAVVAAFAPTTDRVVATVRWSSRTGGPPLATVFVWTSATNTWQPLSNQFPPGSYVEAMQMSDTGVTIGYLYAGSFFGPRYSWKHDPSSGLTLIGDGSSFPARQLSAISRNGQATAGRDTFVNSSWWASSNGNEYVLDMTGGITGGEVSSVSNSGNLVTGGGLVPGQLGNDVVYRKNIGFQTSYALLVDLGVPLSANVTDVRTSSVSNSETMLSGTIHRAPGSPVQFFLIRWPSPPNCDSIDFNNDGLFPTDEDVIDFLSVLAGGTCSNDPHCFDIDFNNDGLFPSDEDLIAFFRVFAGGGC